MATERPITDLLQDLAAGRREALDDLLPLVYQRLRRMAHRRLRAEREGHTMDTADLAHEAYLKLVDQRDVRWQNRAHFFAIAARAMRRILVDHARARASQKRDGGAIRVAEGLGLDMGPAMDGLDVIALDEVLSRLAAQSERACRVVECRVFAGLTIEETAEALGIAPVTAKRDWTFAKTWLHRELGRAP